MFQKVLIATDFSPASKVAISRGLDLARQFGAQVHLLHVVPVAETAGIPALEPMPPAQDWLPAALAEARSNMQELVSSLELDGLDVETHVIESDFPAPGILRYAETHDIDVVTVGTHGRRGLRRLLVGSVAEEVVRLAACTVFTCTSDVDEVASWPREILVPFDFSKAAKEALTTAHELSRLYHSPIRVLHVVARPNWPAEYSGSGMYVLESLPGILEAAEKSLEKEVQKIGDFPGGVETEISVGGASEQILETAAARDVDLIVMGNRGLSGIRHVLLGSVADRVIRSAASPVLVIHCSPDPEENAAASVA